MSDLENELLGLAGDGQRRSRDRGGKNKSSEYVDDSDESDGEMDMDLESEEGEGEDIPAPKPSSSAAAKSKTKAVRSAPQGVGGNPYPLEGKYIDEDDRDQLEEMAEVDREAVLAARLEEMQKNKDRQQLDAMYRMAGMGGDAADEDEDDDEPNRKKRKHNSVSKEASLAMKNLKNKRKAMDERAQRRVKQSPTHAQAERRAARPRDAASESEDEDGEISNSFEDERERERDTGRGRGRDRDRDDYRPSPDRSPLGMGRKRDEDKDKDRDVDAQEMQAADVNDARVGRYELVEMMYKVGFEDVVKGSYVRLMAGEKDEYGRPKYRIHRIEALERKPEHGRYDIEYQGRTVVEDWGLLCAYGKAKRFWRIADVSNGPVEQREFDRWQMTNRADGVKLPKRSELLRKSEAIRELKKRDMTGAEIDTQVAARRRADPTAQRARAEFEISQLIASRRLAQRRGDGDAVADMNRQIVALGGDPETGELVTMDKGQVAANLKQHDAAGGGGGGGQGASQGQGQGATDEMDHDARIARINELKRERVKGNMERAHKGAVARRKAEEAAVRAKEVAAAQALAAQEAADKLAREEGQRQEGGEVVLLDGQGGAHNGNGVAKAAATAAAVLAVADKSADKGGIRKGETPQQYVARTVELDLGDF